MLYTIPEVPPFQVHWTEDVMAEVLHSLRKAHPDWDGRRLTGIRDRLAGTFEAGRVIAAGDRRRLRHGVELG